MALLSIGSAAALAQSQSKAQSQVGQPGKDVIWIATSQTLTERMLDIAQVTANDFVIDLGSGDGVLTIAAARRGARALGIEYDRKLFELSRRRATEAGMSARASFINADIFESDISSATVITMYLTEGLNARLRPRLLQLKPGTRIVSNSWKLGDWRADDSVTAISLKVLIAPLMDAIKKIFPALPIGDMTDHCFFYCTAYLWIVPAKVEGTWRLAQGTLTLRQRFQELSGTITTGGNSIPITKGRLRGDQIVFTAGDAVYSGRVVGGRIDGSVNRREAPSSWNAVLAPG